jgi:radical SAM superfamily enzyme YgiQ (UPF0313 family)
MTDILLIQPPVQDFYLTAKRTIPYGLASMAAVLRNEGFNVRILDAHSRAKSRKISIPAELAYLEPYYARSDRSPFALFQYYQHFGYGFDHIGTEAFKSGAFLVGISASFTAYHDTALATAEAVKNRHPDCRVVMGGHHATALPHAVLASPAVDYVIRGEGEDAIARLAHMLSSRERPQPETIQGVCFRRADGSLEISDPVHVKDLSTLPRPALDLVSDSPYRRKGRSSAVIITSRGCPMHCSYCCVGQDSAQPYRRRNINDVIAEMDTAIYDLGAGFIDFEDENLSFESAWFMELLSRIQQRFGNQNLELRAMNGLFPASLSAEMVAEMKAAGFKKLNLSLGSTSKQQSDRFNRQSMTKAFDQCLKWAAVHGLEPVGYIIVGGPDQAPETSIDDLVFLAQRRVLAGLSVFYPAPGSSDYRQCKALGILPSSFMAMRASAFPIDQATTRDQAVTLMRLGRMLNFMKHLIDNGSGIPAAAPLSVSKLDPKDRIATGRRLLAAFFDDGIIRGITATGEIYHHRICQQTTDLFLSKLSGVPIRGTL